MVCGGSGRTAPGVSDRTSILGTHLGKDSFHQTLTPGPARLGPLWLCQPCHGDCEPRAQRRGPLCLTAQRDTAHAWSERQGRLGGSTVCGPGGGPRDRGLATWFAGGNRASLRRTQEGPAGREGRKVEFRGRLFGRLGSVPLRPPDVLLGVCPPILSPSWRLSWRCHTLCLSHTLSSRGRRCQNCLRRPGWAAGMPAPSPGEARVQHRGQRLPACGWPHAGPCPPPARRPGRGRLAPSGL